MLNQQLSTNGGDYEKLLKQRRRTAIGLLTVGLVGLVGWHLLVPGSQLSDRAQGFYLGVSCGIIAGALALLIRTQRLLRHPEKWRKVRIQETDERKQHINQVAAQSAGMSTVFIAMLALFIALPLNIVVYYTLAGVIVLYFASFLLFWLWLSKKL